MSPVSPLDGKGALEDEWRAEEFILAVVTTHSQTFSSVEDSASKTDLAQT